MYTRINHPYPEDVIASDLWIYYACIVVEYEGVCRIRIDRQYETSINKRTLVNALVHISNLFPLYLQTTYHWGFWYLRSISTTLRRYFPWKSARDLLQKER